jgi:hypothetical protein
MIEMLRYYYKHIAFLFCLLINSVVLIAQGEINANIMIDYSQIQLNDQDKAIIEEAKNAMTNFINNRKWTSDNFAPEERIRCNISISITGIVGLGSYVATAQVQSLRPVYGTSYETMLLNFFDKDFNFSYVQGQPMDFNENIYLNEVTTLLGFYVHIILAMDYDSYSKNGGSMYIEKLRNIVNTLPNPDGGWKQLSSPNNRGALFENLQSQQYNPVRESMYEYHRVILDNMLSQKSPEENHKKLIQLLNTLREFDKLKRPYSGAVRNFFFAKGTELMNLLAQANPEIKKKAIEICTELDPQNTQRYQKLMTMN